MSDTPIYATPWRDLKARLRNGAAVAVAEQALEAIAANPAANAYRRVDQDRVLAEAAAAASRLAVDPLAPALAGAPVSVKDLYVAEGYDTFAGTTRALDARFPSPRAHNGRISSFQKTSDT